MNGAKNLNYASIIKYTGKASAKSAAAKLKDEKPVSAIDGASFVRNAKSNDNEIA